MAAFRQEQVPQALRLCLDLQVFDNLRRLPAVDAEGLHLICKCLLVRIDVIIHEFLQLFDKSLGAFTMFEIHSWGSPVLSNCDSAL